MEFIAPELKPRRPFRWPAALRGSKPAIFFGGDYNPEQWPREVWDEDIRLMKKAGVNFVSLAIFSWARLEPQEDVWDFAWLDEIITKLGSNGIAVDLASATASPAIWLAQKHPEILPIDEDGRTVWPGARQHWRATSPIYREYALKMCRKLAEHYKDNPYVVAWHLGNEYGCHNLYDYSEDANNAFQSWCEQRYHTVEAVNAAWGADFWSQRVTSFDQILVPRHVNGFQNPGRMLDFRRFSSEALLRFCEAERDAIEEICPDKPFTTNFMVSGAAGQGVDYDAWAPSMDFVSNDHYFTPGEAHLDELTYSADLVDGMARRSPWLLMEHSTSAVNWRNINYRVKPGDTVRDSLAHLAFGANGILYFQWRQSQAGAEKFHSAMLPHAGENSQIFRNVCELGEDLRSLSEAGLLDTRLKRSDVAVLFDNESSWALQCDTLPTKKLAEFPEAFTFYRALLDLGITSDVIPVNGDWDGHRVVVVPNIYLMSSKLSQKLEAFARKGGMVIVTYMSGIADQTDRIWLGGYPGALRELTGVRVEEGFPLGSDFAGAPDKLELSNGTVAHDYADVVTSVDEGVEVIATYQAPADWGMDGVPAITLNHFGEGQCVYVGCRLNHNDVAAILKPLLPRLGVESAVESSSDVLRVVRVGEDGEDGVARQFIFLFNRTDHEVQAPLEGTPLLASLASVDEDSSQVTLSSQGVVVSVIE